MSKKQTRTFSAPAEAVKSFSGNCEDCVKLEITVDLQAEEGYKYCWLCIRGYKIQWEDERQNRSLWSKLFTEPFHEAQEDFFNQLKLIIPPKSGSSITERSTAGRYSHGNKVWELPGEEQYQYRDGTSIVKEAIEATPVHTLDGYGSLGFFPGIKQYSASKPDIKIHTIYNDYTMEAEVRILNTKTKEARTVKLPHIEARYLTSQSIPSDDTYRKVIDAVEEMSANKWHKYENPGPIK